MTQDDICRAAIYAQDVSDSMNVAYWADDSPSVFKMKYQSAHDAFHRLAEIMGYKVEVKE